MKILFTFAHPDDETFSSGGTIIKLVKAGHTVISITATRGEAGMVGDPPITTQDKLGQAREREMKNAAKIMGIKKIYFLDFIDGTLENLSDKKLTDKITPILEKEKPDVVITFDKRGGSNHPDHKKISGVVTSLFEKYKNTSKKHVRLYHTALPASLIKKIEEAGLGYNAFGKVEGVPDEEITTIIDIKNVLKTKIKAFKEHKTQRKDWERLLKRMKSFDATKEYFQLISENEIAGE